MIKLPLIALYLTGLGITPFPDTGAEDVQVTVQSEQQSREERVDRARAALAEGDKAFKNKRYDLAVAEYNLACDWLPEAPLIHDLRAQAIEGFSQASVKLAAQRMAEGRYEEAETVVRTLLEQKYNPDCKPALELLAAINPKIPARVEELKRLFAEAGDFYARGFFELAAKRYGQILSIDPGNDEARKREEKVMAAQYIQIKLKCTIIPKIDFKETTVREAVEILHKKSVELDTLETDPARKGVNMVLKLESATDAAGDSRPSTIFPGDLKITISLTQVPLSEALRYITRLTGLKTKIEPGVVVVIPDPAYKITTKFYKVPPGFLDTLARWGFPKGPVQDVLKSAGVEFPVGASATLLPASGKLVVRNTEANMDVLDDIVQACVDDAQPAPAGVSVEVRPVEIDDSAAVRELQFDYNLGTDVK